MPSGESSIMAGLRSKEPGDRLCRGSIMLEEDVKASVSPLRLTLGALEALQSDALCSLCL